ncbi:hypothetical protein [Nostoc sp. TCL240-02]|uniref:hypothetical protein n=1 Tax=Nostoc sp. TCL240-02 TaxID=2572090 RepID=UPI00157F94EB|nr:hypothetical protein [Nostoc sp. TCL240-02]QKQ76576.1 hypothetical protein FBB35_27690 [Nostoc sp. TCL240-02]
MNKLNWEISKLNPPLWWQLHLGEGLIVITIVHRPNAQEPGYHASVGNGLATRGNVLSTLGQAKSWGIESAGVALKEMSNELQPENPWLLWTCLVGAIALQAIWLLLFN